MGAVMIRVVMVGLYGRDDTVGGPVTDKNSRNWCMAEVVMGHKTPVTFFKKINSSDTPSVFKISNVDLKHPRKRYTPSMP